MNVWLEAANEGAFQLQQVPAWVEAMEQALSRFRPDSELSRLNSQAGHWTTVSATMFEVIQLAKHAARLTGGLYTPLILPALIASGYDRSFELMEGHMAVHPSQAPPVASWREIQLDSNKQKVRLPGEIDLGGIAKGWTAQWVSERLARYGACMVDLGGDIVTRGEPLDGWNIAISDPFGHDPIATIQLSDAAIVTSGIDYRRWQQGNRLQHHLIDPRTAQPAVTDIVSATVIHPDAPTAEAYAKVLVLLGSEPGLDWLRQQWHGAGIVVRQDGAVLMTTNMENYYRRL